MGKQAFKRNNRTHNPNDRAPHKKIHKKRFHEVEERKPETATSWMKLKEAFLQQEEELKSRKVEVNNAERDKHLAARNKSYKQFVINEKRKEETRWEDFSANTKKTGDVPESGKDANSTSSKFVKFSDVKKMSSETKNFYKKVITRTTQNAFGTTLSNAINDMKYRGVVLQRKKGNKRVRQ